LSCITTARCEETAKDRTETSCAMEKQNSSSSITRKGEHNESVNEVDPFVAVNIPLVENTNALFGGGVDSLWGEHAQSLQRKRKKVSRSQRKLSSNSDLPIRMQLSQELEAVWLEAQQAYVNGDIPVAIQKCQHIQQEVQLFPHSYQLLGLIYEENGNLLKALEMFYIEANVNTRVKGLLKKVGYMALHLQQFEMGFRACTKALTDAQNRSDVQLHSLKMQLYVHTCRIPSAERSLKRMNTKFPNDIDVYVDFAAACFEVNRSDLGVRAYTHYICMVLGIEYSYFDEKKCQVLYNQCAELFFSPPLSNSEGYVLNNIDFPKLFHAARVSIDALLQGIPGESASADNCRHALFLAVIISEFIIKLRQQALMLLNGIQQTGSVPSIPFDLACLFVLCRLNAQEERIHHASIALKMTYPLLDVIHKSDEIAIDSFSSSPNAGFGSEKILQENMNRSNNADEEYMMHAHLGKIDLDMEPEHLHSIRAAYNMTFESALDTDDFTKKRSHKHDAFLLHQRVRLMKVLRDHGMHTLSDKVLAKVLLRLPSIARSLLHISRANIRDLAGAVEDSVNSAQLNRNSFVSNMYREIALACLHTSEAKKACELFWMCLNIDRKDSIAISGLAFIAYHNSSHFVFDFERSTPVATLTQSESIDKDSVGKDPRICALELLNDHFLQLLIQFERTREKTCREQQYSLSRNQSLNAEEDSSDIEAEENNCDGGATRQPKVMWHNKTEESILDTEIDDGSGNYDGRLDADASFNAFSDVECYGEHYDKFTIQNIRAELRTAVTWAEYMLLLKNDKYSYLSVALPMLEVWGVGIAIRGKPLPARRNVFDESVLPYKRSHILIYMKELQTCDPSIKYKRKYWLDESQNSIWRLIKCLCYFEPIELVLGKCCLEEMAHTVSDLLKTISHSDDLFEEFGSELFNWCLQRFPPRNIYQTYISLINGMNNAQPLLPQMNSIEVVSPFILSLRINKADLLRKMSQTEAESLGNPTDLRKTSNVKTTSHIAHDSTKIRAGDIYADCPFSSESESDLSDVQDDDDAASEQLKKNEMPSSRNTKNVKFSKEPFAVATKLGLDFAPIYKPPKSHRGVRTNMKELSNYDKGSSAVGLEEETIIPYDRTVVTIWETLEQHKTHNLDRSDLSLITATMKISPLCAEAAYNVLKCPHNYAAANIMFREMRASTDLKVDNTFTISTDCLYKIYPNSVVACLLAGHECMCRKQFQDALKVYIDAHLLDPQQPLPCLCIANLLTYIAYYNLVPQRMECYAKALAFLSKYTETRLRNCDVHSKRPGAGVSLETPRVNTNAGAMDGDFITGQEECGKECITQLGLLQETFYNIGRTFHEVELYSLATRNYHEALRIADSRRDIFFTSSLQSHGERKTFTHVTKEAAHNLVIIYKMSNSTDYALQIMQKYLCI